MKVKIEDVVFWILIVAVAGIIIWKLFGSPTGTATLISITLFIAMPGLGLWKKIYSVEKRTEFGFMKVKGELNIIKNEIKHLENNMNNEFNEINKNLENIKSLVGRR